MVHNLLGKALEGNKGLASSIKKQSYQTQTSAIKGHLGRYTVSGPLSSLRSSVSVLNMKFIHIILNVVKGAEKPGYDRVIKW